MDDIETPVEPNSLKFLRRLVTGLTITMIGGVLTIIALLVIRLNTDTSGLRLPDRITLPDGATATVFTVGPDWYGVVTQNSQILIYDRSTGELRQTVEID